MKIRVGELRALVREAITKNKRPPRYIHITQNYLGDTVVLTPRIPRYALENQDEDFTTPRVCFAKSIKNAADANPYESEHPSDVLPEDLILITS